MRIEARVLEGDQTLTALVPLASIIAFKAEHGYTVNAAIADPEKDFVDWEPWLAWHTMTRAHGEGRSFDEWVDAVDWVGIYNAPDVLDPSGGEETQTPPSSPASSSGQRARGRSSSRSTTSSSTPSGPS